MERSVQEYALNALLNVAMQCGAQEDFFRLSLPYTRTDSSRNLIVSAFLENSDSPDDTLVMLDCDMLHPIDVVHKLSKHIHGVVGAMYYRRSEPHDPLFYQRNPDTGNVETVTEWPTDAKLLRGCCVATGAIAIKRWVFDRLEQAGIERPYFRYEYKPGKDNYGSEDMYFGAVCETALIDHFCDVTIQIPHLTVASVTPESWLKWREAHPGAYEV